MLNPNFAIFGALLNIVGCISYAIDTLKGKTQPNRVGWSLWALSPLIAFAAELSQGVKVQSLVTLSAALAPLLVLIFSFADKRAYWKIKPFDWYCAGLSLVALALWLITGKGNMAIIFSICADALACLPTLTKSYTHPHSESIAAFLTGAISAVLGLLTVTHWTFANYAFMVYLALANGAIAGTIIIRGRMVKPAEASGV